MNKKPLREGAHVLSTGEIVERVTFSPEDASISSILRSLLEHAEWDDVSYVLHSLRGKEADVPYATLERLDDTPDAD